MQDYNFIIEFIRVGDFVKVSAIDPYSSREACVIVPVRGYTKKYMESLAVRKLKYLMNKEEVDD